MDFHVIAGVTAPILIAFHASFKFHGIAGFAFWIMVAVAISGFIGRYLYAQIPRSLNAAELSLNELQLKRTRTIRGPAWPVRLLCRALNRGLHVPSAEHIRRIGPLLAIGEMIALDVQLPFQVAGLRRASCGVSAKLFSAGGLFSSGNQEVERVVRWSGKRLRSPSGCLPRSDAARLSSLACDPSSIQLCVCGTGRLSHRCRHGPRVLTVGLR
jgi:hypothetical protein